MPFELGGLVRAEAINDMPTRCECCAIARRLEPQFVGRDKPLRARCPASGVVYWQKQTLGGRLVLAGLEVRAS